MSSPANPSPAPDPLAAAAAAAAAAVAAAIVQVKEVFATSAYGISVLQCYLYFRDYSRDSVLLKLTVTMVAHSLYTYFVLNFGNLAADALTFVTLTAQCYYAWQIWTVSRNVFVVGAILLLAWTFRFPLVETIATKSFQAISGPVQGTAFACDVLITIALIYYLRSRRTRGIRTTEQIVDKLVIYAMCRGIVTAYVALNETPPPFLNANSPASHSSLYVNSILASLNARRSVLGKGDPEQSFRTDSKSTGGGTDSTKTMPLVFIAPKNNATVTFDKADPEASYHDSHTDHQSNHENKAEILPHAVPGMPVDARSDR
ncbi:hypothetical protein GGX14DRAFT_428709 [Mycena pura]|uniref:DUF6534 domain-containing protein n=1 Tax=Mycena pura TaxID=153505 RepID=A0AAD6YL68_9AGAR|nr:hypothetical protein GGX14DRAFT_428709 [Mycena pura]